MIFLLDQATKFVVNAFLKTYESIVVLPFFQIVNVRNTGAAFGLFRGLGNGIFIALSLLAIVIVVAMLLRSRDDHLAYSLILGGAMGNLTDRLLRGYVVDFLDFHLGSHHWPAFNVADSALTIGITLLVVGLFVKR
ncbi:MAG: signal peptidase II [Nitrospirae bacterium]|nr:MAG: signal peptidase II [Nitrospirota bacterium]